MKNTLADIRKKLQERAYRNEEHVRLSLVARILQKLEWDIWDPGQVNTEFAPVPTEDSTKVDFALFSVPREPSVFIEVKAVGKIDNLQQVETQLRDYNRNNTALFCVITDGAVWRLYYSQTGGEFSDKCFKILDFLEDDPEDVESALLTFLGKAEIESGQAKREAEGVLRLTQTQRTMEDCLPRARRLAQEPPFPSLPDALVALVAEQGFLISREDAESFIVSPPSRISLPGPYPPGVGGSVPHRPEPPEKDAVELPPNRPGSLKFTAVHDGRIGSQAAKNWNGLVCAGIKIAIETGHGISHLRRWLSARVEEGAVTDRGFHPVSGTGVSLQYMEANKAWENALILAKELKCGITVRFHWRHNDGAAFPGKEGVLCWSP